MKLQPLEGVEQAFTVPLDGDLRATAEMLGLGLSVTELEKVRDYFRAEKRVPTDIELQAIDQAWSEHCCYKSSRPVLEETVFGLDVPRKVFVREDAGVMEFDADHYYVVGLESHNHPSALDPYGGAATGIGGILRDVVCMGAQPIALVDPLFFGELDLPRAELPEGVKHPRYLMGGVVAGIRDYGNRVGIPTVAGQVVFHPNYTGNPLVNVGCIGVMPKAELIRSRAGGPGDVYILAGGRTGRDGIHGVTFASRELGAGSESDIGAVQLGDPITKEPLMHLCLELNRSELLTGMKDLGGGGLSCVVGELALDGGYGARVDLEKVPLKQPGMAPWEIWVSESQERMMFTVQPENVTEVLERCAAWDVEATEIGEVVLQKRTCVDWHGTTVLDLDLEFTTKGPAYQRPSLEPQTPEPVVAVVEQPNDLGALLLELLATPEVCSRSWIIRQYDHQVRGSTALNPLQGPVGNEGPGDAAVLKPVADSWRGLALTSDVNPWLVETDPHAGTLLAIAEVCGNLAAVGARIDSLADCLCFGNPEKPEIMWQFSEVIDGLFMLLEQPNVSIDELMTVIPAPDFPTSATIHGIDGIKSAYETGRGRVHIRARTHIEPTRDSDRESIIVTELPYQVNKARLIEKIAELVRDKRIEGISELRDISRLAVANVRQNLFGAFIYNVLGIPIAAGVFYPIFGILLSPMIAGAAMAFSSLTVVTNANRLHSSIENSLKSQWSG